MSQLLFNTLFLILFPSSLDDIKVDLKEVGWEGVDCIHLVQDWDQWRAE
jgi:hypothetical protein